MNFGKKTRAVASVAAALAATIAFASCSSGGGAPDESTDGGELVPITVGAVAAVDQVVTYAALERGTFAEYGLQADVKTYSTGVEILNAMNAGEVQYGLMAGAATMTSAAQGLPVEIIGVNLGDASKNYSDNSYGIVAGPDSGISEGTPSDLEGKRIGLPLGTMEAFVSKVLSNAGLTMDDVTIVNVQPADSIAALQQGSIDALSLFEPWPARALDTVDGSVLVTQGTDGWSSPGVIVGARDYVEENPDVTEQFLTAMAASQQWARGNPTEAAEVASRWMPGLEESVAEDALANISFDARVTEDLPGSLELIRQYLVDTGKIDEDFDPASIITADHIDAVEEANPELFEDLPEVG